MSYCVDEIALRIHIVQYFSDCITNKTPHSFLNIDAFFLASPDSSQSPNMVQSNFTTLPTGGT